MERIMKKSELTDEIARRTGFFKKNVRDMVEALSDIVIEHFETAEFDENCELHLAPGIIIGGRRVPERMAKDPRNNEPIMSCEKVIPYATFKQSIRMKLRVDKKNKEE